MFYCVYVVHNYFSLIYNWYLDHLVSFGTLNPDQVNARHQALCRNFVPIFILLCYCCLPYQK
jgi:hypothetical protein